MARTIARVPVPLRTLAAPLAGLAALAVAPAAGAARVYDVPGVGGRSVAVAAAARLDNGGAVVAGTVRHGSARRLVVVRLLASGEPDRSYGGFDGVVPEPQVTRATAVAVDPRTGAAWVGGALGRRGRVIALDPSGRRRHTARLDAPPTALALHGRRLVAATPQTGCRGCRLVTLDARTGRTRATRVAAPVDAGDPDRCEGASVRSLVPAGRGLLLGGTGGSCPTRLATATGRALTLGRGVTRTAVAPASGRLGACIGVQRQGTVALARVDPGGLPTGDASSRPPAAGLLGSFFRRAGRTLVAVAPVGDRGCAALLRQGRRAVVAQVVRDTPGATLRRVPRALHATALFFCRRHVNVLGAHGHRLGLLALPARH